MRVTWLPTVLDSVLGDKVVIRLQFSVPIAANAIDLMRELSKIWVFY